MIRRRVAEMRRSAELVVECVDRAAVADSTKVADTGAACVWL